MTSRDMATLSLRYVLKFLDYGIKSLCFVQGEKVIAADHLILISLKDFSNETAGIVAPCV